MFFLSWGPQSSTQHSSWGIRRMEYKGRKSPPLTCWPHVFWHSPQYCLAFWPAGAPYCLVMSSFLSTKTPESFSSGLFWINFPPDCIVFGLAWPMCRTWPCWTLSGSHSPTAQACWGLWLLQPRDTSNSPFSSKFENRHINRVPSNFWRLDIIIWWNSLRMQINFNTNFSSAAFLLRELMTKARRAIV